MNQRTEATRLSRRGLLRATAAGAAALGLGLAGATLVGTTPAVAAPLAIGLKAEQALIAALEDEYKARATYYAVIARFGAVRPFTSIVKAEESHVSALKTLFYRYEVDVPVDDFAGKVQAPVTLAASCSLGVQAEIDNAALYDDLLAAVAGYDDIIAVFQNLRDASLYNHLPAFQRCAVR
jgi:hypothetical protein